MADVPNGISDEVSLASSSLLDSYTGNPRFQELSSELRTILIAGAQTAYPTRAHTPQSDDGREPGTTGDTVTTIIDGSSRISTQQYARYLRNWVLECAPWLDMFDQERKFGTQVPHLAQTSRPLLYALLALSARQMERKAPRSQSSLDSIELYSDAIVALSAALDSKDSCVLVTACILCVLEMMSASPREWRRHLEGCAALFEACAVHGLCGGLQQAVFWCFARMDLCSAIMAEGTAGTVLPISKWILVPDGTRQSMEAEDDVTRALLDAGMSDADMHANLMVYLCAKVCDLMVRRTYHLELGDANGCDDIAFPSAWEDLARQMQAWVDRQPTQMQPALIYKGPQDFPCAFYPHYAAISAHQLYHTACILLQEMRPDNVTASDLPVARHRLWHARQIVGISQANQHKGCLNNAIQPLYIAGKMFSHKNEHDLIVELLKSIEDGSGWAARWRIKDLEAVWGYAPGTYC